MFIVSEYYIIIIDTFLQLAAMELILSTLFLRQQLMYFFIFIVKEVKM